MLLSEPPLSQGDLRFRVFGFPVRVHPWFWVVAVILGLDRKNGTPPAELLLAVAVILISIVVHELGHAFAQRHFGGRPRITLYGLGGLASCNDCDRSPRSQILISLAGPAAGFAAALLLLLLIKISGRSAYFLLPGQKFAPSGDPRNLIELSFLGLSVIWEEFASPYVNFVLGKAFWINIGWGLINLLPIYPLDGGQVSRELFTLQQPRRGIVMSLQLSMVAAGAMALIGVVLWQSLFTALMFGYLAYSNYQTLQAYRSNRW
jgi:Zn-dependent protease